MKVALYVAAELASVQEDWPGNTDRCVREEGLHGLLELLQLLSKVRGIVDVEHVPQPSAHHHHMWRLIRPRPVVST